MKICIVAGHAGIENLRADGLCPGRDLATLRRGTGSGGERELNGKVAVALVDKLHRAGHEVTLADASGGDVVRVRYDLLLSIHAQRDTPSAHAFAGVPSPGTYTDGDADRRARSWLESFVEHYETVSGIAVTQAFVNPNITEHYLWCYVNADTACALIEVGNLDSDRLTERAEAIAAVLSTITVEWALGTVPGGGTAAMDPNTILTHGDFDAWVNGTVGPSADAPRGTLKGDLNYVLRVIERITKAGAD